MISSATATDGTPGIERKKPVRAIRPASNLNKRQERFAAEYIKDLNATQAAIRAGYSKKTAKQQGSRLLTNVDVTAYCSLLIDEKLTSLDLDGQAVLRGIANIALHGKSETNQLKAYELLGKYFTLWSEAFNAPIDNRGGQVILVMPEKGR